MDKLLVFAPTLHPYPYLSVTAFDLIKCESRKYGQRELQREGHRVVVFEKVDKVGGTWLYNTQVETDLLGIYPNQKIVHSNLYRSLRVNLPRQVMGFLDYPFTKKEGCDPRHFLGHEEVFWFLEDFAWDFGLMELIQFEH
ncbi:Detected protein of unknown function [Hibiscus syriacus]|uniref:Flavin-containing monooxygenase n=1 Tax=Hibiscus syriacus TaxID=106335 RepID=A0A6A3B5U9_HIBSY|nr:Detected protein of unknown function [Hibiscus syriacus]